MSKTLTKTRTAFVGFVAILQLVLLPATHMLHLGCQHSHDDVRVSEASSTESACVATHHCAHCNRHAATEGQPTDSGPFQPSHDKDSCGVCQVAFAARMATVALFDLITSEPLGEFLAVNSQVVDSTPRYCVLSRGPPTAPLG